MTSWAYGRALRFLDGLSAEARTTGATMRLERITLLLELLGNPQQEYEIIHVAGTAGKGSTCAFAESILRADGRVTGLHTSPHLQVPTERMQVGGKLVSTREFARLAERVAPLCKEVEKDLQMGRPTYFEATVAMAFEHFSREKVDVAVVEAGLGGRMDATNLVRPACAVITNVHLDHTDILGKTVEKIARDKAGIIKYGTPCVTGATGEAERIIREACEDNNARLYRLGKEIKVEAGSKRIGFENNVFSLTTTKASYSRLRTGMGGEHQVANAAMAVSACEELGASEKAVREGLAAAFIPCRLEIVQRDPLVVLDGAHNPEKARALTKSLGLLKRKIVFAISIAANKDVDETLKPLAPSASLMIFTKTNHATRKFAEPAELAKAAAKVGLRKEKILIETSANKAVGSALAHVGKGEAVCVTGSLYLCGEARGRWFLSARILKTGSLR